MVNLTFKSVSSLKDWLKSKHWSFNNEEEYQEWLCNFFEEGNSINVYGKEYDYWSCWELL